MVEQDRQGTYEQIVYAPSGGKLALMYGESIFRVFIPLTGGATAVYNSNGLAYYRHSDWLGSSRFASTPSRTMYYDGAYAPFGESYIETGTTDRSFTGMNQDTVPALYDFAAREYGIQGRWPSPDPAGSSSATPFDPRTWNRYAYVRNNPLQLSDPTGMEDSWPYSGGGCDNVDCPGGSVNVDGTEFCDSFCASLYCPPEFATCGTYGTGSTPSAAGAPGAGGLGGQYAIYLDGGIPVFANSFFTFTDDPSNPPLIFLDGAVYTYDQNGNPIEVGAYIYLPGPGQQPASPSGPQGQGPQAPVPNPQQKKAACQAQYQQAVSAARSTATKQFLGFFTAVGIPGDIGLVGCLGTGEFFPVCAEGVELALSGPSIVGTLAFVHQYNTTVNAAKTQLQTCQQ